MSKIIPLTIEGFHHRRHHPPGDPRHHHTKKNKLIPLSIDFENNCDDDDNNDHDYEYDYDYDDNDEEDADDDEETNDDKTEECFLLEPGERLRPLEQDDDGRRKQKRRPRRRRHDTTTIRTHHFHLPSVQIPSSSSSSRTNSHQANCSNWMYCSTFMILLISMIGYFGGGNKIPNYYYDDEGDGQDGDNSSTNYVNDDAVFVRQKDKDGSSSSPSSSDLQEAPSYYYNYNFQPTIRNDYSNVSSRHDLFDLSTHISIHCSYNRSSCPCQLESSSSSSSHMVWPSSSSSSFDESHNTTLREDMIVGDAGNSENSAGTSNSNINSRLVPRPGNLEGWETAFNWNVQTASSKRGTDSNIVFVGDSITELWRGTRLGQQLDNNRKKPTSIGGGGGSSGGISEIAHTFDDLFRTTVRADKYSADNDSDSIDDSNVDDDEFSDDEDEYNTGDEDMDQVDDTNQTDIGIDEERPSKEISFRGLPLGIAGDQTTNLLWRIQNGELPSNLSPSIFVLLIGTNDLSYDECSADNIIIGILQCVEYLLEERPEAQILLHGLLPRTLDRKGYLMPPKDSASRGRDVSNSSPTYFWSTIKAVNSELERYADRRQSVEYLDSSDLFLKRRNKIDLDLIPDGTHPSTEGYQLFGSNLQKKILKMMLNKAEDEKDKELT